MTTTYLPEVRLGLIEPHGANPRRTVGNVDDLAASITEHGLLEPLVLAPLNGTQYRLIAGHRRLAAAKQAGLDTVPAMLREDLDTPPKQLAAMLVENTQRADLTAVEEAQAYAQLVAFPGYTVAKAAKATGRSAKTVKARVALTQLPDKTLERVHTGQVSLADAEALLEFVDAPEYDNLAKQAGTTNFTWAVERARETTRIRHARDLVEKACADHGWDTVTDRRAAGASVLSSWEAARLTADDVTRLLAGLEGPHFFVPSSYGDGWMLCAPSVLDDQDEEDDDELPPDTPEEAARRAEAQAREQFLADIETAREVRRGWLATSAWQQLIGKDERLTVLRLLVIDFFEQGSYTDDDLAICYLPPIPEGTEDIDHLRAWAETAIEPQLWRALCVMSLDLERAGYPNHPSSHATSIRFAAALGYGPSDIERSLLGDS
jgi:ParB family chromosome partitioning protein